MGTNVEEETDASSQDAENWGSPGTLGTELDLVLLLANCAKKDRSAMNLLFDAEAGRMKGIAMRVLHHEELADDALQEAFIQIWQNAAKYQASLGSPRAWMNTIVRFRAIDILRSRKAEIVVDPEYFSRLRDEAVTTTYSSLDVDGRLYICLAAMEQPRREAILLAFVAGMTQPEIAGRLGTPLGTVKSWMRRTLISLRECMQ